MNNKRVPPSVAQFAVSERAELLARIAELGVTIARLESQLSRAIQANYDLRTKLVVPSPDVLGRAFITCESSDAGYRVVIQSETLKEMQAVHSWLARLNAAPVQQVSVPDERAAFEREDRYIVIKRSDMDRIPNQKVVHSFLGALGELSAHSVRIPQRKFLVIESDWPEYDPAWKLIQDRVQGRPILDAAPAAPAADAGLVDMYRHLQKVTPYRFKKIQDASVTDGGDVLYFHEDRFDAALLDDMAAHRAKGVV